MRDKLSLFFTRDYSSRGERSTTIRKLISVVIFLGVERQARLSKLSLKLYNMYKVVGTSSIIRGNLLLFMTAQQGRLVRFRMDSGACEDIH